MKGNRAAGFTLLEIMLVMLLLGAISALIVATLPVRDARSQADRLSVLLNQAAEQAVVEGLALRLQIDREGWQLFSLQPGEGQSSAFLPGYHWHAMTRRLDALRLPADVTLQLFQQQRRMVLPASLLFLPDDVPPAMEFRLQAGNAPANVVNWRNGQATTGEAP